MHAKDLPKEIDLFQLKRMIIPDVGVRYIYTTNKRYTIPYSIDTSLPNHPNLKDSWEQYNNDVLYEIDGEENYTTNGMNSFISFYKNVQKQHKIIQTLNSTQLYNSELPSKYYFRKYGFIGCERLNYSTKIQFVCIIPELQFYHETVLNTISNYIHSSNHSENDVSTTIRIYTQADHSVHHFISEAFSSKGWTIQLVFSIINN